MHNKLQTVVTVIADSNFVIPVYILVLSLKFFQPEQKIHILGISLSDEEKAFFTQFENVKVFVSSIPYSGKPGAMRIIADILKGEAILTAVNCEEPWIALLDGDCIATGDITPYLSPAEPALYARSRSIKEDDRIFKYYRTPSEPKSGLPENFIKRWRDDVGQALTASRSTTVLSGNLILHRKYLDFCRVWKQFMLKVLVIDKPDAAYYMPAEFALSAWLMFANDPPPVREVQLNSNPAAFLAHLGPAPKYWRFWTRRNLPHFNQIMRLLDWAKNKSYSIPALPYALKKRNKLAIIAIAFIYEGFYMFREIAKRLYKKLTGNSPEQQARRYGQQSI